MLPRSTNTRTDREAARGKQSGRTQEIQRLIGRALRAVVDLERLGERTIHLDCDVIQADGGTRTASITGAFVALHDAVDFLLQQSRIASLAGARLRRRGIGRHVPGRAGARSRLRRGFVAAGTDMNVVMTGSGGLVEVQGTAEGEPFSRAELDAMLDLAEKGIRELIAAQRAALRA